jgi:ribokinase
MGQRVSVVGHVEWVEFMLIGPYPQAGDVVNADRSFIRAAGGGGVAATVLAEHGAEVDFFCALGRDGDGEAARDQLGERGVRVQVAWRSAPTRRAVTLLDEAGERTIVTIGDRLAPAGEDALAWHRLADVGGVYFTAGDSAALERARTARFVVATPRAREALEAPGPMIDALIYSAHDAHECEWAERVAGRARLLVATEGSAGGRWSGETSGRWDPVPLPGEPRDAYGCGDSFAAAFTFGLAAGMDVGEAASLGAEWGAIALTRHGAP